MVVLVELRRGDLQTSTKAEMVWLGGWKSASTSPGVRNPCFLPSNAPPDQNLESCSTIGQIFPLILYRMRY
jgi:hypothetical protein